MVITVGNTKGGVGKSTISANLAAAGLCKGMKVLLIDADPQGSTMSWRTVREADNIQAMQICTPTIHKDIERFSGGYDLTVIDAGGRDAKTFRSAVAAADVLLVPLLPSPYDVWGAEDTLEILKEVRVYKDLPAFILFNQVREKTVMNRETREALNQYNEDILPLKTSLRYHEFYKTSVAKGLGIVEFRPGSGPATDIYNVLQEILEHGKEKQPTNLAGRGKP
jgi:chromosome partitioning protein